MKRRRFVVGSLAASASLLAPRGLRAEGHPSLEVFDGLMAAFLDRHRVPGAALAIAHGGGLVYARGFGLASREQKRPVEPTDLFRIASISKPFTAVAILQLAERGRLSLDARVCDLLELAEPADARWKRITLRHLLQHTGGWDRDQRKFDPMFASAQIADALGTPLPAEPAHIIRYMLGQPLEFDPGSRHAYSNFGYCLLGRVIERAGGGSYEGYVREEILAPLGIKRMRLGKTLPAQRAPGEVAYYDEGSGPAVVGRIGARVPQPYGCWYLEAMDAHGGWLASAIDLVRFGAAFDDPESCPLLKAASIASMFARPDGDPGYKGGRPREPYYACGWDVRTQGGALNTWHTGSFRGTSTLLVRRHDGKTWAVLFNARNTPDGERLSGRIDRPLHEAANRVRDWPRVDQYPRLL